MKITPEPHQKKALEDIRKGVKKHDRGQALMATGTGKTLVALWAATEHAKDSILVLVPSLALARQVYLEWRREDVVGAAIQSPWAVVCSDASVTDDEDGDQALKDLEQETGRVIRDPAIIHSFLSRKQAKPAIVISTYQSAPVLAEGLPPKFKFGMAIFDEAHKTAGSAGKLFSFALQDKNLPCKKRLFFTATPRVGDYVTPKGEGATIFHMNDQAVYGPVFHDLSFNRAKELGLVVGYDVVIAVLQGQVQRSDISNDKDEALLAKVVLASQATKDYSIKKMFSFHDSNHNAATAGVYYQNLAEGFKVERVEGSQSAKERENILNRFAEADRSIVTNARCLGEGVNVPSCDAVAFMTPRRSRVDVVQAVGRACRISRSGPRKKKAFVVLPIFLEAGETIEEAMNNSSFKDAMATLNILKDYNKSLSDRIRETKGYVPPGPEENPGPERLDEDQIHILAMGTLDGRIAGLTVEEFKKAFKTQVADSTYGPEQKIADILAMVRAAKAKGAMRKTDLPEQLASAITTYCVPGNPCYRPDFVEALRQIAPELIPVRKTHRTWTAELVQIKALEYKSKSEFKTGSRSAYMYAEKLGILDQICQHMNVIKPSGYWTEERITAEASKYTTRRDFRAGAVAAYGSAVKQRLLDKVCQHMVALKKSWTEIDLALEARKYRTKMDFRQGCQYAYNRSFKIGILDRICQHMVGLVATPSSTFKRRPSAASQGTQQPF